MRALADLPRTVSDSRHREFVHMPFDTDDLHETLTVLRASMVSPPPVPYRLGRRPRRPEFSPTSRTAVVLHHGAGHHRHGRLHLPFCIRRTIGQVMFPEVIRRYLTCLICRSLPGQRRLEPRTRGVGWSRGTALARAPAPPARPPRLPPRPPPTLTVLHWWSRHWSSRD